MKFLIIAAKFGNGHLAVSKALVDQGSSDDQFDIVVPSSYKFEKLSTRFALYSYNNVVSKYTKDGIIKTMYNMSYNTAKNVRLLHYWQKADGRLRSKYLLKKERPDVIIETFPHTINNTMGALRCCVITDYTFAKVYISETKDAIYCVPAPCVKDLAVNKFGLDPQDVYVTGIPVKEEFNQTNDATSCKKVLITLGARGQISKKDIDKLITFCLDANLELKVVCGKNEKIYDYIKDREDIEVYGYVNNMHELYQAVDLVITKSGGISISECICSEKPMIINIDQSMSGQEEKNQNYVIAHGLGLCHKMKDIDSAIKRFSTDDQFYQQVVNNLKKAKSDNYQHRIIDVIKGRKAELDLIKEDKEKDLQS